MESLGKHLNSGFDINTFIIYFERNCISISNTLLIDLMHNQSWQHQRLFRMINGISNFFVFFILFIYLYTPKKQSINDKALSLQNSGSTCLPSGVDLQRLKLFL